MGKTALTMLCFRKSNQTVITGTQNANEIRKCIGPTCIRVICISQKNSVKNVLWKSADKDFLTVYFVPFFHMLSIFTGLTVHWLPEILVNHSYLEVIVIIF